MAIENLQTLQSFIQQRQSRGVSNDEILKEVESTRGIWDDRVGERVSALRGGGQSSQKIVGDLLQLESKRPSDALKKTGGLLDAVFGGGQIGEAVGTQIAKAKATPEERQFIEGPSASEVAADVGQTALTLATAGGAGGAGGFLARLIKQGALGAGFGTSQALRTGRPEEAVSQGAVGAGIGAAFPFLGKAAGTVKNVFNRLTKSLSSGLSGVGTQQIEAILTNPQTARETVKTLRETGADKLVEQNAQKLVRGIQSIRQEARKAFGEGLEQLSKEDIDPAVFRRSTQSVLDDFGIRINEKGERVLGAVEFDDPKNIDKASALIDELSVSELDGKSVRRLLKKIEDSKFKTATTDERLSYNSFVDDLAAGVKRAIVDSTDKLDEINKQFATDMQLAEEAERIFGKVKFGNLSEVGRASERLEQLFNKKGISPQSIDDFFNRIGTDPAEFRTQEAVRQISTKELPSNVKGVTITELLQSVTSSVITPKAVRDIAIITGQSENVIRPLMEGLTPAARIAFIRAFIGDEE